MGFFVLIRFLCNKQNNTWLLWDMEFLFSCATWYLARSLRSLVRYRVGHLTRNSPRSCTILFLTNGLPSRNFHTSNQILNPCVACSFLRFKFKRLHLHWENTQTLELLFLFQKALMIKILLIMPCWLCWYYISHHSCSNLFLNWFGLILDTRRELEVSVENFKERNRLQRITG